MASVRKRGAGVWEVRVFTGRDAAGRPTQLSRTVRGTKRDAERVAAELTVQRPVRAAGRVIGELLDRWLEHNEDRWAITTRRDQASRVALIKTDLIADRGVAGLDVEDVDAWLQRLRRQEVGPASVRNQHLVLRAALTQAVRWRWVPTNVAAMTSPATPRRSPRAGMTADEVRAVIVAARTIDPAAEVALRVAAVAGLRRGEIAALQWMDVMGAALTIDSAAVVERADGESVVVDAPTKTANRRTITIDPDTVDLIVALRTERSTFGPWLFGVGDETPHPDRIGWWWKRSRALAGIDPKWRLHDLRHWSATTAIGNGHDVRTVANRLGHASAAMTLNVYAHVLPSADQALARTIGDVLAERQPPSTSL